jgi:dephospho-CoA kinase
MKNTTQNKKIAITGSLASGKTTVLSMLSDLGYDIFSCDDFVKSLYSKDEIIIAINALFPNVMTDNNQINNRLLLRECMNDEKKMKILESLIHPIVLKEIKSLMSTKRTIIFEIPLLFELKWHAMFDDIVCIIANDNERMERFIGKGYSKNDFIAINERQIHQDEKVKMSTIVIDNTYGIKPEDFAKILNIIGS